MAFLTRMPRILCIESATDVLSIAICDEHQNLSIQESKERYAHAARITQLIDSCTKEAGITIDTLDAIAVSIGPGSYTSLRVGLSTAKGLAYAVKKPLLAIDTLAITAAGALTQTDTADTLIFPMIDARRMEVYGAQYDMHLNQLQPPRAMIMDAHSLDDLLAQYKQVLLCGNGTPKLRELYQQQPKVHFGPDHNHAQYMRGLAVKAWRGQHFADVAYTEPFYLKAPNITTPKKVL